MELIMSRAGKTAVIAIITGVLSLAAFGAVVFTPSEAEAAAWCGSAGGQARDCGFATRKQCRASFRNCFRNPRG